MKLLSKNYTLSLKPTILAITLLGLLGSTAAWGVESDLPARAKFIRNDPEVARQLENDWATQYESARAWRSELSETEYPRTGSAIPRREIDFVDQQLEQSEARRPSPSRRHITSRDLEQVRDTWKETMLANNQRRARFEEWPMEKTARRTVAGNCNSDSVADMITAWGDAWAKQDLEVYFSYYMPDFKGDYRTPAQWRKNRTRAIESAGKIDLRLSDIEIDVLDNCEAVVTFKQYYRSDLLSDVGAKELGMQFIDGQWRIQRETFVRKGGRDAWRAAMRNSTWQSTSDKNANASPAQNPARRNENDASSTPQSPKDAFAAQAPQAGAAAKANDAAKPVESAEAARAASQIVMVVPESQSSPGSARVTWEGDGVELVRSFALAAGVAFAGVEGNARRVPVNVKFADMPLRQALETVGEALGADVELIVRPTEYLVRFK